MMRTQIEYIDAIKRDVHWLGFDWAQGLRFASEQLYAWACHLVHIGKAYLDHPSVHDIRDGRGTLTSPSRNSPFRDRSEEENAELFARMRAGEFRSGERVLRAKIDMASTNMNLRDPVIYRILNANHPRTGAVWHIYPSYDFAHGQCDATKPLALHPRVRGPSTSIRLVPRQPPGDGHASQAVLSFDHEVTQWMSRVILVRGSALNSDQLHALTG
jgi:glutaminyl-tRNA synthetase